MCILLLRGAQTPGEIRGRTGRLFEFVDVRHVDVTLEGLMTLSQPLVTQLERQPGQKEARWAHLMSGEPVVPSEESGAQGEVEERPGPAADIQPGERTRLEALEETVDTLRAELADLRARFEEFRREFQ